MKKSEEKYIVPAVDQAAAILFCLAETTASHLSLMEIYKAVGIHKSKAYSILQTLQKAGLIQRNIAGKGYSLGPGLITLSRKVLDNFNLASYSRAHTGRTRKKNGRHNNIRFNSRG